VELQKPIKHSALSSDGGFLETTVTGVTNLSEGSIVYGDASEIVTELPIGSSGDSLSVSGSGVPEWITGGGAGAWVALGNDVQSSAVASLSVTSMTGHDVYQVIYSIADEATGSPQNCAPRMRISNGGSTYDNTYALVTAPNQTDPPTNISNADEWKLNGIGNGNSFTGVFYIYAPNSNFTNGYDGTMIQGQGGTTAGQMSTLYGNNDNTADITSVEVFFMQDDGTIINMKGSLQVNGMNYA